MAAAVAAAPSLAEGHTASVNCLALDAGGSLLASGSDDAHVCLWDAGQLRLTAKWRCGVDGQDASAPVAALAFSGEGGHLLFAAHGGLVSAWDLRLARQPLLTVCAGEDEVNSVALLDAPGERRLATADDTGAVKIFDSDTGELVRALHKHENIASAVLFRPGRTSQVISGGMDCRLVVTDWKSQRGEAVNIFEMGELQDQEMSNSASSGGLGVNPPLVHCLAASPDGRYVAAGLESGSVELFSGSGRHLLQSESLYGHSAGVSALLCLPGHLLLSGGNDRRCYLWSLDSEQAGASLAHHDKVNALCGCRPDRVFVADSGSTVHCCDLSTA